MVVAEDLQILAVGPRVTACDTFIEADRAASDAFAAAHLPVSDGKRAFLVSCSEAATIGTKALPQLSAASAEAARNLGVDFIPRGSSSTVVFEDRFRKTAREVTKVKKSSSRWRQDS